MQMLKPELREAILHQAKQQFLLSGYERVTMKSIAAGVSMSVGNIYRYFANKDQLFEAVVTPAVEGLDQVLKHHGEPEAAETTDSAFIISAVGDALGGLLDSYAAELLILVDGSKGTPFEHVPDQLYDALAGHIVEHLRKRGGTDEAVYPVSIARPAAVGFLQGFFEIIRQSQYDPSIDLKKQAEEYFRLHYFGLQSLI